MIVIAGGTAVLAWWITQLDLGVQRVTPQAASDGNDLGSEVASTGIGEDAPAEAAFEEPESLESTLVEALERSDADEPSAIVLLPGTSLEMSATRWDDPFHQDAWLSDGWDFAPDAMQTLGMIDASAIFRRAFRRVVVECALQPAIPSDSTTEQPEKIASDDAADRRRFELRLVTYHPDVKTGEQVEYQTIIGLEQTGFQVSADGPRGLRPIEDREIPLEWTSENAGVLRMAATGNRIVIVWNGRRVLACNQPVAQSGQLCFVAFRAATPNWRIERLRIEGE